MERVIVKVRGAQTDADGEVTRMEMVAEGKHYVKNGKHYVLYEDTMLLDGARVSTVLKIAPDAVALLRSGSVRQEMRFDLQATHVSMYRTPFGEIELGVQTDTLDVVYGSVSGTVDVRYRLSVNGQRQSVNDLRIEINAMESDVQRLH